MVVCFDQMADNYQNGRRSASHFGGHPNDPRLRPKNSTKSDSVVSICRDFVRGTCDKYRWCKFRHEWDIDEIIQSDILKFCHIYQNNRGQCTKLDCKYLHATSEEEELFKTSGQIPQILADRHAAFMNPNNAERALNSGIYNCNVSLAPPLPPPVNTAAPLPPSSNMVMATTSTNGALNMPPPAIMTKAYMLPPPPPPPPLPPPSATRPTTTPGTAASNMQITSTTPVLPLMFDASRPPPPLPVNMRENGKHKLPDSEEAGPRKIRKPDHSKASSGHCDNCVQRQIRIVLYKQEMEKLLAEDEKRSLAYKKKLQALEKGKQLIRSRVSYDLYQFIEEYVEGIPDFFLQSNDLVSQSNQTTLTTSMVSKQILLKLMKFMARNISESSLSLEESLLPALRAPVLDSPSVQSGDLLQEIADVLAQCEHRPASSASVASVSSVASATSVSGVTSVGSTGGNDADKAVAHAPVYHPGVRPPPPPQRAYYASYPPSLGPGAVPARPPPLFYSAPPPPHHHHYFPYRQ